MPDDIPAALPLIAYAAGLALGGGMREIAGLTAVAILVALLRRRVAAITVVFLALGVTVHARVAHVSAGEERALAAIDVERFVAIEAPIDRDWSRRGDSFVIRVPEFAIGGRRYDRPLAIYARFEPPPIAMEKTIVAEGLFVAATAATGRSPSNRRAFSRIAGRCPGSHRRRGTALWRIASSRSRRSMPTMSRSWRLWLSGVANG